jgi:hypothetical protein
LVFSITPAQDLREASGYFTNPRVTPFGVVCTNDYSSVVYLVNGGLPEELISGAGCGAYVTLSADGRLLAFKLVDEAGMQTPVVYDIPARTLTSLEVPGSRVGQVSFSARGRIAFTRGEELTVIDGATKRTYPLGTYANLTPLSPDGTSIVYNDTNDQLWIYRLETGDRRLISDGKYGYFNPQWAPDGTLILYSSLNGFIRVFDLNSSKTYDLGEGNHPSWSTNSRIVAFSRQEISGQRIVNSELFITRFDGSGEEQLTATPDVLEMDPSFVTGDNEIVCQTGERRSLAYIRIALSESGLAKSVSRKEIQLPSVEIFRINPSEVPRRTTSVAQLDIPYVHQAYDTPDWFNGDAACAPTAAIMLLAYYNILPPWPTPCSTPSFHYNNWGNYVCTQYQFNQVQYLVRANDPNSRPAWGGYGFMWNGSNSPHTRMADYYTYHGMTAIQTEGTSYSVAYAEVAAGYPFTLCVMLTSAGHLVLAHGIGEEPHTFIFNDCWGDKNRGYKNYYGKNVRYDWPGYNNGYQNLTGVAWCIGTRYNPPAKSDTVIDDLQFDKGFVMQTAAPSSMSYWKDKNGGYQGHAWYVYSRNSGTSDTCVATWTPALPADGVYEVAAYVPGFGNATEARYQITYSGGTVTKSINQVEHGDSWVSLGTYSFAKGGGGMVRLGDQASAAGQILVYDAVRWSRTSPAVTDVGRANGIPSGFGITQNYPNPFNPTTNFELRVSDRAHVTLNIFDILGRHVETLVDEIRSAGVYIVHWDASALPSGVYYCRLNAGPFVATKRMVLTK